MRRWVNERDDDEDDRYSFDFADSRQTNDILAALALLLMVGLVLATILYAAVWA